MNRIWDHNTVLPLDDDIEINHHLFQEIFTDLTEKDIKEKFLNSFNQNSLGESLYLFLGKYFNEYLQTSQENIIDNIHSNASTANDELRNVFTTFRRLESMFKNNSSKKIFLEKLNINENTNDLYKGWKLSNTDINNFITNIFDTIKNKQSEGDFFLQELQEYRRTPEARKAIFRKTTGNKQSKLLDFILERFPSIRIEAFTRIELYIESGWAAKDKIFEKYYSNELTQEEFVEELKTNIGKRFKKCNVQEIGEHPLNDFKLVVGDSIGSDLAFDKMPNGVDGYIEDVNGNILVAEASAEESGYRQGNKWDLLARALLNYEKENNVTGRLVIALPSLTYDLENDTQIKKSIIEKFSTSKEFDNYMLEQLGCLQIISSLDRLEPNNKVDRLKIMKKIELRSIGNSSDLMWKELIESKNYKKELVGIIENIGRVIESVDDNTLFFTKGMQGNAESSILHLFTSSFSGLITTAYFDKDLRQHLCKLNESWNGTKIASKFAGQDHQGVMFGINLDRCNEPMIKIAADRTKKILDERANKIKETIKNREILEEINKENYKEMFTLFKSLIKDIQKDLMAPYLYSSNSSHKELIEYFFKNFNDNYYIYSNSINNSTTESPFSDVLRAIEKVQYVQKSKENIIEIHELINQAINTIKETFSDNSSDIYECNGPGAIFRSQYAINTQNVKTARGEFLEYCNSQNKTKQYIFRDNKVTQDAVINEWAENLENNFKNSPKLLQIMELKEKISNNNEITNTKKLNM